MHASEMVRQAIEAGLMETEEEDYGHVAGCEVIQLAAYRGLDADHINLHRSAHNHASIADIVTAAIRKPDTPAYLRPPKKKGWNSSSLLDPAGDYLRRILPVGMLNEERRQHEIRSWHAIGEVVMMRMPMQLVVVQMGVYNGGRRHGYWTKGLLHPQKSSLRFRKRSSKTIDGFKETWIPVWREEHDEISREDWLQAMFDDDVLHESLFVIKIDVPGELEAQRIRDMACRKLDAIAKATELPDKQLSTCDGPLMPCPYRRNCWDPDESVPSDGEFEPVS